MGHGVRAALVTGIIHAIAKELVRTERSPGDFLTALNKRLAPIIQKGEDCLFATAAYFSIDVETRLLVGAAAGHPPPFIIQPEQGTVSELSELNEVRGPALAIIDDYTYPSVEVQFQAGEELLMYTDGVCEAMNSSKDEFGVPHLQQTIQDYNTLPLNELFSSVIKVVKEYTGSNKLGDDACLLGFRLNKLAP